MYDILIKNGTLADGTGAAGYVADIAIRDGKIEKIGRLDAAQAKEVIDASGRWVTPGFIDPHSHADMSMMVWPKNEAYLMQGVTTCICGNCGLAAAPLGGEFWEFWCWEYKSMNRVWNHLFMPYNFQTDREGMLRQLKADYDLDVSWSTLPEFFEFMEKKGFSFNYYPLSGHNHIRNAVLGKCKRPATPEELEKMKAVLRAELEGGSQGFSTGLDYEPGRYADTAEVIELVKVVKEYGGVYNTHTRNFDPENPPARNAVYGVREATDICRATGVKTNISHMYPLFDYTPVATPEMDRANAQATVAELERGWRDEGLPMMYDVIANPAMGGSTIPCLIKLFSPWVGMCGSPEAFMKALEHPDFLEMVQEQANSGKVMMFTATLPDMIRICKCSDARCAGKMVREIMREQKLASCVDAMLAVLRADLYAGIVFELGGSEAVVETLLSSPRSMPSSDGFAFDLDSVMDDEYPMHRRPHPNNYCFAIRYLLNYGAERFEDKVRQMTAVPAEWYNLPERGTLEAGKWADIVIIDRENLRTNENLADPGQAPDGIDYVLVNGRIAIDHKKHTGAKSGRILRRKS